MVSESQILDIELFILSDFCLFCSHCDCALVLPSRSKKVFSWSPWSETLNFKRLKVLKEPGCFKETEFLSVRVLKDHRTFKVWSVLL